LNGCVEVAILLLTAKAALCKKMPWDGERMSVFGIDRTINSSK